MEPNSLRDPKICAGHIDCDQFSNASKTKFKDGAIPNQNLNLKKHESSPESSAVSMNVDKCENDLVELVNVDKTSEFDVIHDSLIFGGDQELAFDIGVI